MGSTKKTTANETEAENVEVKNQVKHIGACAVFIDKERYVHGDKFSLTDEQLKSQGVKYLFVTKVIQFVNDEERTEELIAEATKKAKVEPERSAEERETGGTIK